MASRAPNIVMGPGYFPPSFHRLCRGRILHDHNSRPKFREFAERLFLSGGIGRGKARLIPLRDFRDDLHARQEEFPSCAARRQPPTAHTAGSREYPSNRVSPARPLPEPRQEPPREPCVFAALLPCSRRIACSLEPTRSALPQTGSHIVVQRAPAHTSSAPRARGARPGLFDFLPNPIFRPSPPARSAQGTPHTERRFSKTVSNMNSRSGTRPTTVPSTKNVDGFPHTNRTGRTTVDSSRQSAPRTHRWEDWREPFASRVPDSPFPAARLPNASTSALHSPVPRRQSPRCHRA